MLRAGDGNDCHGGNPSSPLRKVTSWSSPLGFLLPDGFPHGMLVESFWGGAFSAWTVQSPVAEILHKLMQFMISKVTKLLLGDDVEFSHLGWRLSVGVWGSPSFSEGGDWSFEGSLPTALIICNLMWISKGTIALTAIASSHNTIVTLMAPQVAHCMSSVECKTELLILSAE